MLIAGILVAGAALSAVGYTQEKEKEQAEKDEAEQRKAELDLYRQEQEIAKAEAYEKTASSKAQASLRELEYREQQHQAMVDKERQTTTYVDDYREQLGLTGDKYDSVLDRLYSKERAIAEETLQNALDREKNEGNGSDMTNYKQIALFSILGIASVGTLVYIKKRNQ